MHSFQNFIVKLIPNHPPPLETRIWKLVVRALVMTQSIYICISSVVMMIDRSSLYMTKLWGLGLLKQNLISFPV